MTMLKYKIALVEHQGQEDKQKNEKYDNNGGRGRKSVFGARSIRPEFCHGTPMAYKWLLGLHPGLLTHQCIETYIYKSRLYTEIL